MREGQVRIPSGCAISGMISKNGTRMNGESIIQSISVMHDRSNGLGGGFAAYGIYPEFKDFYAFHVFYDDDFSKEQCYKYISGSFEIVSSRRLPTSPSSGVTL